jgi:Leucine-rich repeat (LRR) protein
LERLSLRGTDITDTTLQQYLPDLTNLRSLDISYTQITNAGLESLSALQNLEELALGANKINGAGLHVLKLLPRLKRLDLHGRQARNTEVWTVVLTDLDLKLIGGLTQLESLNLGGVRMTDFGAAELGALTPAALARSQPNPNHDENAGRGWEITGARTSAALENGENR